MPIFLPQVCRPASPSTRSLLESLRIKGVLRADGCVITSTTIGKPPAGYDHVMTSIRAGHPPLEASRIRCIRSTMAAEVMAIVEDLSPGDCQGDRVVQATYTVDPAAGVEVVVEMHGLVDRVAHVSIS
jgi:hypothetical protein